MRILQVSCEIPRFQIIEYVFRRAAPLVMQGYIKFFAYLCSEAGGLEIESPFVIRIDSDSVSDTESFAELT